MSTIVLNHIINGALANATQIKLKDSGNTYGIKETVSGVIVVAPTAAIAPTSTGVYEYDISALSPGKQYTATWEVYYPDLITAPHYSTDIFNVDADIQLVDGVTLADIEYELATRVGPHDKQIITTNTGQTTGTMYIAEYQTLLPLPGPRDMYVLRRGLTSDPNAPYIPTFNTNDRIRRVYLYDHATGILTLDRVYANAVQQNEIVEFHYIHPMRLREAVLAGLKRAKVADTINITTTAVAAERNLTASAGWLTRQSQIQGIQRHSANQHTYNYDVNWVNYNRRMGDLYAYLYPDPYPMSVDIRALRPAFTMVNGETVLSGPNDDMDIITVDLDYATAAAHVELWRRNAAELQAAAQLGYQVSKKEAANTFSMLAMMYVVRKPQKVRPASPGGMLSPFRTQDVISLP